MKIISNKGVWLINRGQFRFVDGENGAIFEPGEPTKALRTQWVKDQSVIVRCADPTNEDAEDAAEELAALIAQDEAERNNRQASAEAIMAKDNAAMNAINAAAVGAIDAASANLLTPPEPNTDGLITKVELTEDNSGADNTPAADADNTPAADADKTPAAPKKK